MNDRPLWRVVGSFSYHLYFQVQAVEHRVQAKAGGNHDSASKGVPPPSQPYSPHITSHPLTLPYLPLWQAKEVHERNKALERSEAALREQLKLYGGKFEEIQTSLEQSNDTFKMLKDDAAKVQHLVGQGRGEVYVHQVRTLGRLTQEVMPTHMSRA